MSQAQMAAMLGQMGTGTDWNALAAAAAAAAATTSPAIPDWSMAASAGFAATQGMAAVAAPAATGQLSGAEQLQVAGLTAGQTFNGTVAYFNHNRGWGFIECPETHSIYGKDVFLLQNEIPGGATVNKGDKLTFGTATGPKGIQACNVQITSFASANAAAAPPAAGAGGPSAPSSSAVGSALDQIFYGTIKSFDIEKGWGFISCDAAKQVFGKDVFITKQSLPDLSVGTPGTEVEFTVRMEEKGLVATWVKATGPPGGGGAWAAPATWPGAAWPAASPAALAGLGPAGGWATAAPLAMPLAAQRWGVPAPTAMPSWGAGGKDPPPDQLFFGTMKTINAEKGWGHITCEVLHKLYNKDMFVMKSNLEGAGLTVGTQVQFTVAAGPKGPHATNIKAFNPSATEQWFTGTIKNFNDSKGFGFIECEQSLAIYNKDVFVHKRELNEAPAKSGDQVQFQVDISGGRPAAKSVVIVSSQPAAPATAAFGASYGPAMVVSPYSAVRPAPY